MAASFLFPGSNDSELTDFRVVPYWTGSEAWFRKLESLRVLSVIHLIGVSFQPINLVAGQGLIDETGLVASMIDLKNGNRKEDEYGLVRICDGDGSLFWTLR